MTTEIVPASVVDLCSQHRFGVLATSGEAGPHTSLVSFAFADDYTSLIFPTLGTTRKFLNIRADNRVSLLLDNRSVQTASDRLYALTIQGTAQVIDATGRSAWNARLLSVHPGLSGFIELADTVLVSVTVEKVLLVEDVENVREFICV